MADTRRFLPSVRLRATAGALAMIMVVLGLGAVLGLAAMRGNLSAELEASAHYRMDTIVTALEEGAAPDPLVDVDGTDDLVQIVAPDGTVIAASDTLTGAGAIPSNAGVVVVYPEDTEYLAVSTQVAEDAPADVAGATVIVGRSMDALDDAAEAARRILVIALPVLILVVGVTTWWLIGGALRPIDRMRREVEEISAVNLDRRVPDPGGDDELARLAATMNLMLGRLDSAAQAQRRFISDASHELRSPLAAIRQYAEVAQTYPDSISTPDLAGTTLAEALRMQRLVEAMLLLSRSDEKNLAPHVREVDLDDVALAQAHWLRARESLTVRTSGVEAARVRGDEGMLTQAVRNLVDNAARHAASTVTVAVTVQDGWAVLDVDDDGDGIPEAERERVFDRFVRLDEARARDDGGSGLGLAIVFEIVTAHHGTVQVLDAPGGGARVRVRLPS